MQDLAFNKKFKTSKTFLNLSRNNILIKILFFIKNY